MPYFQVLLSGSGISLPFEGATEPVIGFFTTRFVRAIDLSHAGELAKEVVLAEWSTEGIYSASNQGAIPSLTVENAIAIGTLTGILKRNAGGYTFYCSD